MRSNGTDSLIRRVAIRDENGHVVEEKKFTVYADLLTAIHAEGIRSLETEVVQVPTGENGQFAVVKATLRTGLGTFTGLGDASPESVEPDFVPHLLRVAETRAKARALRDALGIGLPAIEELSGPVRIEPLPQRPAEGPNNGNSRASDAVMSESQRRYLFRLLQTKGLEGEGAKRFLTSKFKVERIDEITRNDASALIDRLLNENGDQAGGGSAHA